MIGKMLGPFGVLLSQFGVVEKPIKTPGEIQAEMVVLTKLVDRSDVDKVVFTALVNGQKVYAFICAEPGAATPAQKTC